VIGIVTFLLKVDKPTWKAFKTRIATEGRQAHWTIVDLIRRYAHGEIASTTDSPNSTTQKKDGM
jgi:hypothetical protein